MTFKNEKITEYITTIRRSTRLVELNALKHYDKKDTKLTEQILNDIYKEAFKAREAVNKLNKEFFGEKGK